MIMIYPVPSGNFSKKKKKKKSKLPIVIMAILLVLAVLVTYVLFSFNSLKNSREMTEDKVDYLFFLEDQKDIVFIRTDLAGKISYVISFPSISYEPIRAVSTDLENPKEIYSSIEKLFGSANMGFYATIDKNGCKKIAELVGKQSVSTDSQEAAKEIVDALMTHIPGFFEFLFFGESKKVLNLMENDNLDSKSSFRLLHMLNNYAMKFTPLEFLTQEPVKILKYEDHNTHSIERLYIDEKGLRNVKEFMEK